jgi:hypothetical protein
VGPFDWRVADGGPSTQGMQCCLDDVRTLFDEFGAGLGVRRMPRLEDEIQLYTDVVVPDRGRSRDLDRIRADELDDEASVLQERDETVEVGCFLCSNSHPQISIRYRHGGAPSAPACEGSSGRGRADPVIWGLAQAGRATRCGSHQRTRR